VLVSSRAGTGTRRPVTDSRKAISAVNGTTTGATRPEQNGQSAVPEATVLIAVRPVRPQPSTQQMGSVAEITTINSPRTQTSNRRTFAVYQRPREGLCDVAQAL
jgi:hypothetical protein